MATCLRIDERVADRVPHYRRATTQQSGRSTQGGLDASLTAGSYTFTVVALLAAALVVSHRASAFQGSDARVLFGPVGIGVGQGARLNVYSIGNPNDMPWSFTVRIFNTRGEVVQERAFRVAPGAIGSLEIALENQERLPVDRLGRRTLRAEIVGFNPQPDPPSSYAATFEVYNQRTGRTTLLLGGPDTAPAPTGAAVGSGQ